MKSDTNYLPKTTSHMNKETLLVALSNQKGGVGKSAFTVLLASYYHYVKNLNVAVIDCDSPQHSLSRMRERDMQAIGRSDYFKQQIVTQFERIQKKAYPIVNSTAAQARNAAEELMRNSEHRFDLIFIDLPGTMESRGVLSAILNMDYVLTPIIADRMVMQSSLSFSSAVLDYIRNRKDIPLKGIYFFWNRVDRRTSTEVFDAYRTIMQRLELNMLDTVIPETRRYDKELALAGRSYFRCTLLPPPLKLLKGSGLEELATELAKILNLNIE